MKIKSIADIRKEYKNCKFEELDEFLKTYESDSRLGVQKIIETVYKYQNKYQLELQRVDIMLNYERLALNKGGLCIAGIDEAGRGPLAGPVVAAAVVLDINDPILYVNDSKKLSAKMREQLYEQIIERAISYGVGVISEKVIDEVNILNATYLAMKAALNSMTIKPDYLLNDAVIIPGVLLPQEKIIKGDAKSLSIAAASILAKVTRDRLMIAYDEIYPGYGFFSNKGYGSNEHIEAIKCIGLCPIHRHSFVKNFISE